MKIGLYGGSFDPVHRGHVEPLREAHRELELDRVMVFPTARPPHKPGRALAPAAIRFAMTELAFLDDPEIHVCPFEMEPERVAYTIDTVRYVAERFPRAKLHLIVGADSLSSLHTWREWQELVAKVVLVALARPNASSSSPVPEVLAEAGATVRRLETIRVDVSSTEIREMLARGEDPGTERVPRRVLDYLQKYDDYRHRSREVGGRCDRLTV